MALKVILLDYLKSIEQTETRDSLKQSWKEITKGAEDEARQLAKPQPKGKPRKQTSYAANEAEQIVRQTYQTINSSREKISGVLATTNH
jgi:hypothetical protein